MFPGLDSINNNVDQLKPVVSTPPGLVPVGFIKGSLGTKGDLKLVYEKSFLRLNDHMITKFFFNSFDTVWINNKFSIFSSNVISVAQCKDFFKLNLEIVRNREIADFFSGAFLEIPMTQLPKNLRVCDSNQNLLNFKIVNIHGQTLGTVDKVYGNGFHDWIFSGQIAIPIVDKHIKNVDLLNRKILVDWDKSWS